MENIMDQEKLKALAAELAKDLKTPADLSALSAQLTRLTVEAALNAVNSTSKCTTEDKR
jgi:hypothetical protein